MEPNDELAPAPVYQNVKKHNTKDLLTIFSDKLTIHFMSKDRKAEVLTGRWCTICKWGYIQYELICLPFHRDDEQFLLMKGKHHAFHAKSNLSCHLHIQMHYKIYQEHCVEQDIAENHHVLPWDVMTACCAAKKATKAGQMSLDGHISIIPGCHAFS